jgi:hypothetical protein
MRSNFSWRRAEFPCVQKQGHCWVAIQYVRALGERTPDQRQRAQDAPKQARRLRRWRTAQLHVSTKRIITMRELQFLFYYAKDATKANSLTIIQ